MFVRALAMLCLILLPVLLLAEEHASPLPNWIDPLREQADGLPPAHQAPMLLPGEVLRLPAEFEPARAVVLGWQGYTSMLTAIAQVVAKNTRAEVWAVGGPATLQGVPADRYRRIDCDLDTVWMRDYGPFGLLDGGTLGVIDAIYRHYQYRRRDDRAPTCIADEVEASARALPLILDGGNLMLDGQGSLFMTKRTYTWNDKVSREEVDRLLREHFGVRTIHALDYAGSPGQPADGTGHIDMFVKLLAEDVVLVSMAAQEPFRSTSEAAVAYFKTLTSPNGKPYRVFRVKGWASGRTWYTYTNSLLVDEVALLPSYSGHADDDRAAAEVYRQARPGLKVEFIPSDASIGAGGSIHCITQLVPRASEERP
ncbi:MAG: hypothetical protein A2284_01065 [Deltaproteobacteria bacterium RIFOXYA12_FULL_61_11]|nr:MAG: hypothetical protein A2284_01065 [Deltaproteobacteria bacterium RIFOXYA12_FULL_61_11]